jgi:hypothetical protein
MDAALRRVLAAAEATARPEEPAASEPVEEPKVDDSVLATLWGIDSDGTLLGEVIDTFLRIAPCACRRWQGGGEERRGGARAHRPQLPGQLRQPGSAGHGRPVRAAGGSGPGGKLEGTAALVAQLEKDLAEVRTLLLKEKRRIAQPGAGPRPAGPVAS